MGAPPMSTCRRTWRTRQLDVFPNARIELLPGVGHWAWLEQPERVAELVVPFPGPARLLKYRDLKLEPREEHDDQNHRGPGQP